MEKNFIYNNISIICSGEDYTEKKITNYCKKSDYIIAVDGGLKILDGLLIKPDLIMGDMDSIDKKILSKYDDIKKEIYPVEKDFTDSELAIKKAINLKSGNISVFAATGSYFDHSIANIINLLRNYNAGINIKIHTKNSEIFPIFGKKVIKNLKGRRISLFPIGEIDGIIMKGFKYNFKDKSNLMPIDYSVSNIISSNNAYVDLKKGKLICILFDENFL